MTSVHLNAAVSHASQPASFWPTPSLSLSLMPPTNDFSWHRTATVIGFRWGISFLFFFFFRQCSLENYANWKLHRLGWWRGWPKWALGSRRWPVIPTVRSPVTHTKLWASYWRYKIPLYDNYTPSPASFYLYMWEADRQQQKLWKIEKLLLCVCALGKYMADYVRAYASMYIAIEAVCPAYIKVKTS